MNGSSGSPGIDIAFALIEGLIELLARHKNGEDISADLDALQKRTRILLDKEQKIADGEQP